MEGELVTRHIVELLEVHHFELEVLDMLHFEQK
jgi:hypothetical protein